MTHVLYLGLTDFNLQTKTLDNEGQILTRILFPANKFAKDENKQNKKGEQELCFTHLTVTEQNTFLFEISSDLWAFGNSLHGQLGVTTPSVHNPVNISQIARVGFKYVGAGTGFVMGYSTSKKLYLWGNVQQLKYGELLKGSEKVAFNELIDAKYDLNCYDISAHFSPQKKQFERRNSHAPPVYQADISGIKCYGLNTYILSQDNLLILGNQMKTPLNILGISCGPNHILSWDKNGRVWSWGEFADGKLGYMQFDLTEQETPRLVESLEQKIIQCACGQSYSIALDVKGDIYTWGKGPFKIDLVRAVEPTKIFERQLEKPIIKIMAGYQHFGGLSLDGKLYGWGLNTKNCLFTMDEENKTPEQFNLKNLRIVDAGMSANFTVIIIPTNSKYKLPNFNLELFASYQKMRVSEQASVIMDRKIKIDQQQNYTQPVYTSDDSPVKGDNNVEKTTNFLVRMKTLVDMRRSTNGNNLSEFMKSGSSKRMDTNYSKRIDTVLPQDQVQFRLRQLEHQSALFLPVIQSFTPQPRMIESADTELQHLLSNENDVLKFQYIQMVKEQDENKVLMHLLQDKQKQEIQYNFNRKPPRTPKDLVQSKKKNGKFKDHFDFFKPTLLEDVKKDLEKLSLDRLNKLEKKKKLREEHFKEIQEQMHDGKHTIQSREQITIQQRKMAEEREIKLRYVQIRKDENFRGKMSHLQQQIYEKSPEFRNKRRLELLREQQNMDFFKIILAHLNMESVIQMVENTCSRGLENKRLMFKEHMKARMIQNFLRKRNVIKKITVSLKNRQKKILLSFLFKLKIYMRIKKKYIYLRKVNLNYHKTQLIYKIQTKLKVVVNATQNIQRMCVWFNQTFQIQLSYLNHKWDEYLKQQYRGMMLDKEKEELKQHQQDFDERLLIMTRYITIPLKSQLLMLNELKLITKPKLKASELRYNLIKKIRPSVQIDDEYKEIKNYTQTVLLPYTRFTENVVLPVNVRIRFDYQQIHQYEVEDKINLEECKIKIDILKEYLRKQRKEYIKIMKDYYVKLNEFKEKNKQQISTERMKLMMKLTHQEIQLIKSKDDQEIKQILQKRELARKRKVDSFVYKDIIFNRIRQLPQDQYPFPGLILKMVEGMCQELKPKLRIKLLLVDWIKLFQLYYQEFKSRQQQIMNEARKNAAQRSKHVKKENPKLKKGKTRMIE